LAIRATGGLTSEDKGYFFRIMVAAAILLGLGYLFGQFLLAHCWRPGCDRLAQHLELATACSFIGMGCLVIASENQLPKLFLPLGAGILGYTALTSFGYPGTAVLMVVDFVLVIGVIAWVLMAWRLRRQDIVGKVGSNHAPGARE